MTIVLFLSSQCCLALQQDLLPNLFYALVRTRSHHRSLPPPFPMQSSSASPSHRAFLGLSQRAFCTARCPLGTTAVSAPSRKRMGSIESRLRGVRERFDRELFKFITEAGATSRAVARLKNNVVPAKLTTQRGNCFSNDVSEGKPIQ